MSRIFNEHFFSMIIALMGVFLTFDDTYHEQETTYIGHETDVVTQIVKDQDKFDWLENAEEEYLLWDNTRVDIWTSTHAIEVDWPQKWAEAVGQSMYYAALTNKKPGIILLVSDPKKDERHIYRCQTLCEKEGIDLWLVKAKKPSEKKNRTTSSKQSISTERFKHLRPGCLGLNLGNSQTYYTRRDNSNTSGYSKLQ